jgi:hypothetical protein
MVQTNQKYSHELLQTNRKREMVFMEGFSFWIGSDVHYLFWYVEFELGEAVSQECVCVESKSFLNRKPFDDGKFINPPTDLFEELEK